MCCSLTIPPVTFTSLGLHLPACILFVVFKMGRSLTVVGVALILHVKSLKNMGLTWLLLYLWMLALETYPPCYVKAQSSPCRESGAEISHALQLVVRHELES